MQHFIAIDNVCAWPNLTKLPDGTIIASIFNQPTHGLWEGDVECWASEDGGRHWVRRGIAAPHEDGSNRMNVAAGLADNDDLIVIASGWDERGPAGTRPDHFRGEGVLPAWVCRSSNGGRKWEIDKAAFPARADEHRCAYIPFGDVLFGANGVLAVCCYGAAHPPGSAQWQDTCSYFVMSYDDGETWRDPITIGNGNHNETTPLYLGHGRWLAAARTADDGHLELFRSEDNGQTWGFDQILSLPRQHPAHLYRLNDGRILLTYGVRCPGHFGVYVRFSADEGKTWDAPRALVRYPACDSGYPSTVQNGDGSLCTAYYASERPAHHRYHMATILWQPDEALEAE